MDWLNLTSLVGPIPGFASNLTKKKTHSKTVTVVFFSQTVHKNEIKKIEEKLFFLFEFPKVFLNNPLLFLFLFIITISLPGCTNHLKVSRKNEQ